MKNIVNENATRFLISNIVLAFLSYFFLVSVNSARPGSVDKVDSAIRITGILLILLNTSFLVTVFGSAFLRMRKMPLLGRVGSEILVFALLFWIAVTFF